MRKEGISHKQDELKIQKQNLRELTGGPELYVGVLFLWGQGWVSAALRDLL